MIEVGLLEACGIGVPPTRAIWDLARVLANVSQDDGRVLRLLWDYDEERFVVVSRG